MVSVGDHVNCPECATMGCVVWVSEDKKTMGVRCHTSHSETIRMPSKFGAVLAPSTKNKKNVVFITEV